MPNEPIDSVEDEGGISPIAILFSILAIALVVLVVWWLVRLYQSRSAADQPAPSTTEVSSSPAPSSTPGRARNFRLDAPSSAPVAVAPAPAPAPAPIPSVVEQPAPVRPVPPVVRTAPTPAPAPTPVPRPTPTVRPPTRVTSTGPGSDVGYSHPVLAAGPGSVGSSVPVVD